MSDIKTEIISIGDELLIGQVTNTNASWMAAELNKSGIRVSQITAISDSKNEIQWALGEAEKRADIVLLTGGLGPTKDDITKKVLAEYFNSTLIFHEPTFEHIASLFGKRNFKVTDKMGANNKSELVLNSDGSLYHINLKPGNVAETIMLVGDPGRVEIIAGYFESIEFRTHNREIHTVTGTYNNKRLTVMSSGMGPDNIEIVVNELDALFNIDLESKKEKEVKTSLNLIRIGTSGALQPDIPVVNSYIVSEYGLGLDGLAYFYRKGTDVIDKELTNKFIKELNWDENLPRPYAVKASDRLLKVIGDKWKKGITLTAPGFYAPQGRELRLEVIDKTVIDRASLFSYNGVKVTNFEMETSALYVLSAMLGHKAVTVCDIIANRVNDDFNPNYKNSMKALIAEILDRVSDL